MIPVTEGPLTECLLYWKYETLSIYSVLFQKCYFFRFKIYKNGDLIFTENKGDPSSIEKELREWLLSEKVSKVLKMAFVWKSQ